MSTNQQADTHGAVQALLPWFANETLPADEMALVRGHLRECPQCREDAAWQERLRAAGPAMPAGLDPERALARLMPQLGPQADAQADAQADTQPALQTAPQPAARPVLRAPSLAERWRALWSGGGWMPWALAGQGVLIAGLLFQLLPGGTQDYRALSNGGKAPPPPAGNVVVVFRPDAQLGQVQQMLQAQGARVVDGPTVTGAYVLDVPDAAEAQVLAALKAYPLVQLAEPLNARRAP
ncbi:hypothetical protein ASC94_03915 [Massilia sp. Root418]|uniref:zf-HC2 domain-containing protein n=1 Tax=Massilia sp. Root418 TaxID=1736532 RepID=UPI0006F4BA58|nr:zf-HC2 domain-containing protein [Massilia sp. Root418]KQX01755.1 hypothetical protein ASC94_03915 [Massilia sp. Root418]